MTIAILTILGALIPFGIWLYRTNREQAADPLEQNRKRYEQIDQDIAGQDSKVATGNASADLDELDRLRNGKDH